ncbi:hypothetical protein FHW36_103507 [Chitinophaga polysaccharea]|uniref:Methylamine utilisation protein MauE domain-containing protein n=1 Tax=Chitinophaga polysaccharea TaxID=1293035 RepID=A0A561PUB4_9BACT|nr:MauE/DoxX family redox-associated membrane protein [Chitinophaga polysaccharea]TWF41703.1 hypothetical protein FHW36_103507 [Chitinophaga polysaccharea]
MKKKQVMLELIIMGLVFLFVYTPASKLMKFHEYVLTMKAQPFAPWFSTFLTYAVPTAEILAVILLVLPLTRKTGLYLSLALMTLFTGYIGLVQLNYYGKIPCTCGGFISSLTWNEHLVLNVAIMLLIGLAFWLMGETSVARTNEQNVLG